MVKSMTGFGRAAAKLPGGKVTVEIKTVNHKFFDATLRLPNGIVALEGRIKEVLQGRIIRGKAYLNLAYGGGSVKEGSININREVAKKYHEELIKTGKTLGLKDDVTIKDLMALPGVLSYESGTEDLNDIWPGIKEALDKALDHLIADREKEGRSLCRDLTSRARKIESRLAHIKARAHLNIEEYRRKFADRVKDLSGGRNIDAGRLAMEVAIFAKNSDISEEITRLKNHLVNFNKTISGSGEVGKKIDFIAQELHREINTIGAKASDSKISNNVIEIKSEIEKIREQAKNLE